MSELFIRLSNPAHTAWILKRNLSSGSSGTGNASFDLYISSFLLQELSISSQEVNISINVATGHTEGLEN